LGFEITKETYAGSIKPITIGKGDKAVTVGGSTCFPFYLFEGDMPNKPKVAMEVWDKEPEDWPEAAKEPFKDVLSDPAAWAKKCVEEYGADIIVLQLKSTDPNDDDASPDSAVKTVKSVLEAINVPLVLWGTANNQKDEEVLKKISEACDGENLCLGPVEEDNHKGVGASAMGFGHTVVASSPIDVNLAKQINILLENLGLPTERMLIDPTTGGLGYGMEYSFSVMERLVLAAMTQGDDKLQLPIINNLGNEVWRCKEAKDTVESAPELGDPERRDIMMEMVGAVTYLIAGSDILILRHPESVRMVKAFIDLMIDGGSAENVDGINKRLQDVDIDFAAMAPEPDLTIEEEEKKPAAKKEAAPKKEAPKKEEKKEEKPAAKKEAAPEKEAAPKKEEKPAAEAKPAAEPKESKEEAEAKAKAEAEAKAKADEEAKKKAEEEAKKKAEEEERKKAEEEEKKKKAAEEAEKKKKAEEASKREAEEQAIREKRAKEREELEKKRAAERSEEPVPKTPAAEQKSELDKIVELLDRVHRRA
jgi:acetyl-CoA decarbonylase/synthase complex subunit delta